MGILKLEGIKSETLTLCIPGVQPHCPLLGECQKNRRELNPRDDAELEWGSAQ